MSNRALARPNPDEESNLEEKCPYPSISRIANNGNSATRVVQAALLAITAQVGLATTLHCASEISDHQKAILHQGEWSEDSLTQEIKGYLVRQTGLTAANDGQEDDEEDLKTQHRKRILLGSAQISGKYSTEVLKETSEKADKMIESLKHIREANGPDAVIEQLATWSPGYSMEHTNFVDAIHDGKGNCQARTLRNAFLASAVLPDKEVKIIKKGKNQYGFPHEYVAIKMDDVRWTTIDGPIIKNVEEHAFRGEGMLGLDNWILSLASNLEDQALVERITSNPTGKLDLEIKIIPSTSSNEPHPPPNPQLLEQLNRRHKKLPTSLLSTPIKGLAKVTDSDAKMQKMLKGAPPNPVRIPKPEMRLNLDLQPEIFSPNDLAALSDGDTEDIEYWKEFIERESDTSDHAKKPISLEIDGNKNDFEWLDKIDWNKLKITEITIDGKNNPEFAKGVGRIFEVINTTRNINITLKNMSDISVSLSEKIRTIRLENVNNLVFANEERATTMSLSLINSSINPNTNNETPIACEELIIEGNDNKIPTNLKISHIVLKNVTSASKIKEALALSIKSNREVYMLEIIGATNFAELSNKRITNIVIDGNAHSDTPLTGDGISVLRLKNITPSSAVLASIAEARPKKLEIINENGEWINIINDSQARTAEYLIKEAFAEDVKQHDIEHYHKKYMYEYVDESMLIGSNRSNDTSLKPESVHKLESGKPSSLNIDLSTRGASFQYLEGINWSKVNARTLKLIFKGNEVNGFEEMKRLPGLNWRKIRDLFISAPKMDNFQQVVPECSPFNLGISGENVDLRQFSNIDLSLVVNLMLVSATIPNSKLANIPNLETLKIHGTTSPAVMRALPSTKNLIASNLWSIAPEFVREYVIQHQVKNIFLAGKYLSGVYATFKWIENTGITFETLGFDGQSQHCTFDPNNVSAKIVVLKDHDFSDQGGLGPNIGGLRPEQIILTYNDATDKYLTIRNLSGHTINKVIAHPPIAAIIKSIKTPGYTPQHITFAQ